MPLSNSKRVIVLGIDGLDPNICQELMSQGRLPNLARLAEKGTFSPLTTVNPPQSPVAWSGIATGTNPGRHGIYDFIIRNPKNYLPDLSLIRLKPSRFGLGGGEYVNPVQGTTFWQVAAKAGLKTTVVRWPVTFPAAGEGLTMLAGLGAPDVKGTLGRYTYYTEQPDDKDSQSRGAVLKVEFKGRRAETAVLGPLTSSFGRRSEAKIDLGLTRQDQELVMDGACQLKLAPGQWSDWQTFKFDLGLTGGQVSGIGRFYLTSLKPLGLYLTPIQIDPKDPSFPLSHPKDYAAELAQILGGPFATLGMPEETKGLSEDRIPDEAFLEMCTSINSEREKMFDFELGRFKEGLLAFVFDTSDRIQHMFWRLRDPSHPLFEPKLAQKLGRVIDDHYGQMDAVLGRALAACDDQTALMVCSDHGFASYTRSVNLNTWLNEAGYLALKKHDPHDPGELFKFVDWSQTKAYALGFGSIYLNLAGREKEGQVKPGDQADQLARQIASDLKKLKDPASGQEVISQVHTKAQTYSGPLTPQAPELVVGYHPPFRVSWTTAIGGQGPSVFKDNDQKWSGDHCVDASFVSGVLAANFRLNKTGQPQQTQVAATALGLLGLDPPPDMEPGLI